MAHARRLTLPSVPRPPKKLKPGPHLVRITFMLEADLVRQVDEVAARLTAEDESRRGFTRTDALRVIIRNGLANHAEKRGSK